PVHLCRRRKNSRPKTKSLCIRNGETVFADRNDARFGRASAPSGSASGAVESFREFLFLPLRCCEASRGDCAGGGAGAQCVLLAAHTFGEWRKSVATGAAAVGPCTAAETIHGTSEFIGRVPVSQNLEPRHL